MPALLMYYWQMKLHCKLFNLNNLVKMPVTSKFSFLQTQMSNMKPSKPIHNTSFSLSMSWDPPSQEPQTQSIQAGPQALNPLCPPWSLVTSCGLMIPEKVYDEQQHSAYKGNHLQVENFVFVVTICHQQCFQCLHACPCVPGGQIRTTWKLTTVLRNEKCSKIPQKCYTKTMTI